MTTSGGYRTVNTYTVIPSPTTLPREVVTGTMVQPSYVTVASGPMPGGLTRSASRPSQGSAFTGDMDSSAHTHTRVEVESEEAQHKAMDLAQYVITIEATLQRAREENEKLKLE